MSRAYYNEIDPFAAQWLRNLITAGLIAPGDVDERDIRDVMPADLKGYTQCHFFAGVGAWSLALRRAGWPDDRPVWTGSCPCQPFSAAGRKGGFTDERHLWPAWHHLISVRRPPVVFGEQVASKDGLAWLDLVQADLEGTNYASAAVDLCAAGVGAPHIRQRLWLVAERLGDADHTGLEGRGRVQERPDQFAAGPGSVAGGMADTAVIGDQRKAGTANYGREETERPAGGAGRRGSALGGLADACSQRQHRINALLRAEKSGRQQAALSETARCSEANRECCAGPVNGFWSDADWIFCRDGKWRSVEPGTQPLAHESPARVVCVCADCETETVINDGMHSLRKISEGHQGRLSEEVLQQGMLQASSLVAATYQQKHGPLSGAVGSGGQCLQSLRIHGGYSHPPYRPRSVERLAREFGGAVFTLSSPGACGRDAGVDMRSVWKDFSGRITSEPKQDLFCPVCQRVGAHQCHEEMAGGRVGRLRAYGNAIVAEVAATVVASYMDAEKSTTSQCSSRALGPNAQRWVQSIEKG